jgi:esterase/lipase superfamily enzyme
VSSPSPLPHRWFRYVNWDGIRKEISLRERCFGGKVRQTPLEMPGGSIARARRLVLLIHGFNVSLCEAGESFEKFTSELPFRWQGRSLWVYWPGDATFSREGSDHPGGLLNKMASVTSYPFQPDRAVESAYSLLKFLKHETSGRKSPVHLTIVAHSLGCLMAMDMVEKLALMPQVKLELVVLMAAAVPQYSCKRGARYDLAKFSDTKFVIYYSKDDEVLQGAFRPGQFGASTNPITRFFGRGAIGRKGLPAAAPNAVQTAKHHRHSGYWADREIVIDLADRLEGQARAVAKRFLVARLLGAPRGIPGRAMAGRSVVSASGIRQSCTCT